MRWSFLIAFGALITLAGPSVRGDTNPGQLADNAFAKSDKDKDKSLNEDELRQAMVSVRSALQANLANVPGEKTGEKVMKLLDTKKLGSKVDEKAFKGFVTDVFKDAGKIVQDAKEDFAKKQKAEQERLQEQARKQAEQARKNQQNKKNNNNKNKNNNNKNKNKK